MTTQAIQPSVYPQLTSEFKQRRVINWLAVGLLYAFFYTTRYNWTVVSPKIADVLGWGNAQLGVFETWMPIVYAFSVIFNGPIADRIGGKKAFLFGAVGVVIMNVLFGLASTAIVTPSRPGSRRSGPRGQRRPTTAARNPRSRRPPTSRPRSWPGRSGSGPPRSSGPRS